MLNLKRGSIEIVSFVLLTIALICFALFSYSVGENNIEVKIGANRLLESIYLEENLLKYQIFIVGNQLLKEDNLTNENFKEVFLNSGIDPLYVTLLKPALDEGTFDVEKGYFYLTEKVEFSVDYPNFLKIDYAPDLKVSFLLTPFEEEVSQESDFDFDLSQVYIGTDRILYFISTNSPEYFPFVRFNELGEEDITFVTINHEVGDSSTVLGRIENGVYTDLVGVEYSDLTKVLRRIKELCKDPKATLKSPSTLIDYCVVLEKVQI